PPAWREAPGSGRYPRGSASPPTSLEAAGERTCAPVEARSFKLNGPAIVSGAGKIRASADALESGDPMAPRSTALHGTSPPARRRRRPSPALLVARSLAAVVTAMVAVQLLEACGFHARDDVFDSPQHLYDILNGSPYVEDATVSGERHRVIDEPKLKVDHGYTCAGALRAASKEFLGSRAFDSATLPD